MQLELRNVSFKYSRKLPYVIENQNFIVESHERVGIFAPSGFGKTTLSLLMANYLAPTKGEILIDDAPLPKKGLCPVQLIYQHPEKAINPRWKLRQVLEESGKLREDVISSFGIENAWLDRYPRELSGGELQRFCVARALMSDCKFLICDEISAMLDVITSAQIWNKILAEAEEKRMGVVVVTHNLALAKRVCTKIYDLSKNEMISF